jgi:hypothetical protein
MISKPMLPIALLVLIGSPVVIDDCETGCHTTIIVTDCAGTAVSGATIELKLCCGNNTEVTARTDQDGKASLNYCLKDICGSRITLAGFSQLSFDRNGCSGDSKNSQCEVKICPR